jgi:hypothetical protein
LTRGGRTSMIIACLAGSKSRDTSNRLRISYAKVVCLNRSICIIVAVGENTFIFALHHCGPE